MEEENRRAEGAAGHGPDPAPDRALVQEALEPEVEILPPPAAERDAWHISLRLSPDCLRKGLDPIPFLRYLEHLGTVERIVPIDDSLPGLPDLDPARLYLGFEVRFRSEAARHEIEDVFEYLRDGSEIVLVPPGSAVEAYLRLLEQLPEPASRLGEVLVSCGALTRRELERALEKQSGGGAPNRPIGQILVEGRVVPRPVVEAALDRQRNLRGSAPAAGGSVNVQATRIEALVASVGELVTAAAAAAGVVSREGNAPCRESIGSLSRMVEEVRDCALGLRMVPIGDVFRKLSNDAREAARSLGKDVDVRFEGHETEIDNSLSEQVLALLGQAVRHGVERGIEDAGARQRAGKPARGTVQIRASLDAGSLALEVSDDGDGGIGDSGEDAGSRQEGLECVRAGTAALRGEFSVEGDPGRGTAVRMRIPPTQSIIDGFRFQVGRTSYVVPLESVRECADLPSESIQAGVVRLRDEALPFLRLREIFSVSEPPPARESLVVVLQGGRRVGLVVDRLAGETQAVVKPLGSLFRRVQSVGGTAVLGDGSIALVLDVSHLGNATAATAPAPTAPVPTTT